MWGQRTCVPQCVVSLLCTRPPSLRRPPARSCQRLSLPSVSVLQKLCCASRARSVLPSLSNVKVSASRRLTMCSLRCATCDVVM